MPEGGKFIFRRKGQKLNKLAGSAAHVIWRLLLAVSAGREIGGFYWRFCCEVNLVASRTKAVVKIGENWSQ